MKALISPNEKIYSFDRLELGSRVAQVDAVGFPIAQPLFWIDCPNECVADKWYYSEGNVYPIPLPPES